MKKSFLTLTVLFLIFFAGCAEQKAPEAKKINQVGRISAKEYLSLPIGASKSEMIKELGQPFTFQRMVNVPERICYHYKVEKNSNTLAGGEIIGENGGYTFCLWNNVVDKKRVEQIWSFNNRDLRPYR
jgi:hypothetical protein